MILRIPGMLDPHVHLRDLSWAHKATFASETAAALAGGYWAILDMPNTPPPTIDVEALAIKRAAMAHQAVCDWGLYFGASQDGNQSEYVKIADQVIGLKIYNNATTGTLLIEDQSLRDAHYRSWKSGKPIAVHAEGETVAQILELVRRYRRQTHFCHISTRDEIELLRAAKEEGLPVSIGVTPHHLYLTDADVGTLGSFGLMKPTLKTQTDVDSLWGAVQCGLVDVIESDHAPHTITEKQSPNPPFGVPGLETTLPLLCRAVEEKRLSYDQVVALVATNPQRIYHLSPPPETYTLVDTSAHFTVDNANLHTLCGWSPFAGMRVSGRIVGVWIRGMQVFDGENLLVEQGFGHDLAPTQVYA